MDVYSAIRWSAASKYGAQAMGTVVSLVLARLLAPEYFGLLGMATVVTGFVNVLHNLGFHSAIIQRKRNSDELLSTLFWVNLALCLVIAAAVLALAPVVGWFYQDGRVTPIVAALSVQFVLSAFTMIPKAALIRQMAFKKLAVREIATTLVGGAASIVLALWGWGVWSLVVGPLVGTITAVILLNILCPFRPRMVFDRQGLRECLAFGLNLTGFGIFNYFARNADNLIIGVFLGPVALGYYMLAYKLMLLPRDAITNMVGRVLFPALCRMQDDDERLARAYLRACGAIAFITFPMMAGLAVVARPFVEVVLGERWLPVVPLIWILAPVGALQSVGTTVGQIFLAKGKSDWLLWSGVVGCTFLVLAIVVGVPWGIVGIAAAYSFGSAVWIPMSFWIAFRLVSTLSVRRLCASLAPYVAITSLMVGATVFCSAALRTATGTALSHLLTEVIFGVLVYMLASLCIPTQAYHDLLHLTRTVLPQAWLRSLSPRNESP